MAVVMLFESKISSLQIEYQDNLFQVFFISFCFSMQNFLLFFQIEIIRSEL